MKSTRISRNSICFAINQTIEQIGFRQYSVVEDEKDKRKSGKVGLAIESDRIWKCSLITLPYATYVTPPYLAGCDGGGSKGWTGRAPRGSRFGTGRENGMAVYLGRIEGPRQPDLAERRHGRGRRQRRRDAQVVFHGRGRVLLLVLLEPALELLVDQRVRVRRVPVLGLVPPAGQRRAAGRRVHVAAVDGLRGRRRYGAETRTAPSRRSCVIEKTKR